MDNSGSYKRILVTGGAGFIGSHLTARLLETGLEVVVLDDLSTGSPENVPPGAELVRGSVTERDPVMRALEGVDAIFHLAARVSARASLDDFHTDAQANVMGTLNVLDCARSTGVRRIIYASSAAVYGECEPGVKAAEDSPKRPMTPYGISKLAGEMYVKQICLLAGLEYQVLRFFNVYGPGQLLNPYSGVITIFVKDALAGKVPTIFGDGEQVRDFICVEDVAHAGIAALETPNACLTLNIATGTPCSVKELAGLITGAIGLRGEPSHTEAVPGEIRYSLADTRRAERELEFTSRCLLEDRIGDVVDWIRSGSRTAAG